MRYWQSFGIAAIVACSLWTASMAEANDAYDLGNVQVVGADARSTRFGGDPEEISLKMGQKQEMRPEMPADPMALPGLPDIKKANSAVDNASMLKTMNVGYSRGTKNYEEMHFSGVGESSGYKGTLSLSKEHRDGFRSYVNDEKNNTRIDLQDVGAGAGSYELDGFGTVGTNRFGQRGTNAIPTPDAGIKDSYHTVELAGRSTLADGAHFTLRGGVDSTDRNVENSSVLFTEDSTLVSSFLEGDYRTTLRPQLTGHAQLSFRHDSDSIKNGKDSGLTKRFLAMTAEHEISGKTFFEFGFRNISLMDKSLTSPQLKLEYRPGPWQAIVSHEQDLGNDHLKDIYLRSRYVESANLSASLRRRTSGRINYRSNEDFTIGAELFRETEDNAAEFTDCYVAGKGMWATRIGFAERARRSGLTLNGSARLDQNFTVTLKSTIQDAKDDATGRKLAYEPGKELDVSLAYAQGPLRVEVTRKEMADRKAYVPTEVDASDYSRADLTLKYNFKKSVTAYLDIQDLYDEAKSELWDVPEQGRYSKAGLEMNF
ncbi:MAG: TonB-dependent receptor [Candidatus Riflebacteria bacterium]|nr:TonB-dependent receptor [Candidatus Riflebacteria bacterium]